MNFNSQNNLLISVVVCTYNRSSLLHLCLESLLAQNFDKSLFEILIIDNNSNDQTQKVVENFIASNENLRILVEARQGISFARNRGFLEARGKYVAYLDDDACANENWLFEMANFIKNNPKVRAFGGPYDRFFLETPPNWFPDDYGKNILREEDFIIDISKGEWISGSNMVFSKDIFIDFGGFNVNFGPIGNKMIYGEETDLFLRLIKSGVKIYYVHSMMVKHLVADYKFRLWWLLRSNFSSGVSYSKINLDANYLKILSAPFIFLFFGIFKFLFTWNEPFKKKIYQCFGRFFFSLGRSLGFLKFF